MKDFSFLRCLEKFFPLIDEKCYNNISINTFNFLFYIEKGFFRGKTRENEYKKDVIWFECNFHTMFEDPYDV